GRGIEHSGGRTAKSRWSIAVAKSGLRFRRSSCSRRQSAGARRRSQPLWIGSNHCHVHWRPRLISESPMKPIFPHFQFTLVHGPSIHVYWTPIRHGGTLWHRELATPPLKPEPLADGSRHEGSPTIGPWSRVRSRQVDCAALRWRASP